MRTSFRPGGIWQLRGGCGQEAWPSCFSWGHCKSRPTDLGRRSIGSRHNIHLITRTNTATRPDGAQRSSKSHRYHNFFFDITSLVTAYLRYRTLLPKGAVSLRPRAHPAHRQVHHTATAHPGPSSKSQPHASQCAQDPHSTSSPS